LGIYAKPDRWTTFGIRPISHYSLLCIKVKGVVVNTLVGAQFNKQLGADLFIG
jgi:hypothetical protein